MRKTTTIRSTPRLMLRRKAGHQADEMTQVFRFINDPSDPTRYATIFQSSGLHEVERLKEDAADPANSYGWHRNTKGRPRAATVQSLPLFRAQRAVILARRRTLARFAPVCRLRAPLLFTEGRRGP